MKTVNVVLATFSLVSFCRCNMSDNVEELTNGYQFVHEGKEENFIVGNHNIDGNIVSYAYDGDFIIAEQVPDKKLYMWEKAKEFHSRYEKYASFIKNGGEIDKSDSGLYQIFIRKGASFGDTNRNLRISEDIVDSIMGNDSSYQRMFAKNRNYWIIYNPKDTLIGPLTKQQYLVKRKELKVPDDLQLDK